MPTIPNTKLSLERWRQLAHIPPAEFYNLTFMSCPNPPLPRTSCNEQWGMYPVDGSLNYFDLATQINISVEEITAYLGNSIHPEFVCDTQSYPANSPFPPNITHQYSSYDGRYSTTYDTAWPSYPLSPEFQEMGIKTENVLATATQTGGQLTFEDRDSDGFFETAVVTLVLGSPPESTKDCWISLQFSDGRDVGPITVTQNDGVNLIIELNSYQIISQDLYSPFYDTGQLDVCQLADDVLFTESVTAVETYPDFTNQGKYSSYTSNGCGCGGNCDVCTATEQTVCVQLIGNNRGVPIPADYDVTDGFCNLTDCSTLCRPDKVELYYFANPCQTENCDSASCVTGVCAKFEKALYYLSATRLGDICDCSCAANSSNDFFKVQREAGDGTGNSYNSNNVGFEIVESSPFGTRWGEVMAYRILRNLQENKIGGVVW